jgi:hypothetical protein
MEKPTDAYKETHNLVLAPKDSLTGGQVSSLQVSPLICHWTTDELCIFMSGDIHESIFIDVVSRRDFNIIQSIQTLQHHNLA